MAKEKKVIKGFKNLTFEQFKEANKGIYKKGQFEQAYTKLTGNKIVKDGDKANGTIKPKK